MSKPAPGYLTQPIFGDQGIAACFRDAAMTAAMLRVEAALATAQAQVGVIPQAAAKEIAARATTLDVPSPALAQGVAKSGVPVPALVAHLKQALSAQSADWVHFGATSQDIVDTASTLCFGAALDQIAPALAALIDSLAQQSATYCDTVFLARTRGQLATPITFGLRIAQWAQPLIALEAELPELRSRALRIQLGGASGSRAMLGAAGADIAAAMARELGISDSAPWHTDRSGIRALSGWLDRLVAALSKIGADLALSSRGEVAEAYGGAGGGSSTMPHKSNPVTAEALQSLACLAQACAAGLGASAVHAEERDGRMWAVEWLLMPQMFEGAGAALHHAQGLCDTLRVREDAMLDRIAAVPEVMAEAAVFALAPSIGRQQAEACVKQALASGAGLKAGLAAQDHAGVDWDQVLDPVACVPASAAVADQIFAAREKPAA